jgi:hypothetical protein
MVTAEQNAGVVFSRGDEVSASIKPVAVHVIAERF